MSRSLTIVQVPPTKRLLQPTPGFAKKILATWHIETGGLCGFSCTYCSSNSGQYLRIKRADFGELTFAQTGRRVAPVDFTDKAGNVYTVEPGLTFSWGDVAAQLEAELRAIGHIGFGQGETVVISQLTDAFAGEAFRAGFTERMLDSVTAMTKLRVRILTKNSVTGLSPAWLKRFADTPDRYVVGLSIGSLDDAWAERVEIGTPPPSARLKAHRALQDAGASTYGMLCPIFPDVLSGDGLDRLLDAIRPELCEHVWAEPFNDRGCWRAVQAGYPKDSPGWTWFEETFGPDGSRARWSAYATELYQRLWTRAKRDGWLHKLRYLLYEGDILLGDAPAFAGLEGVLLQGQGTELPFQGPLRAVPTEEDAKGVRGAKLRKPLITGWSRNPAIRALQRHEGHGYAGGAAA